MLPCIQSHRPLAGHPKTTRLARRLGISVPAAIGHLHLLWWWAAGYTEAGNLAPYAIDEIEAEAMWDGEPGELIASLVAAGFIDETPGGLTVHDWYDYWGKHEHRLKKQAEYNRGYRERTANTSKGSREHIESISITSRERLRGEEIREYIPPISPIDEKPAGKITQIESARTKELTEGFEEFYRAYPRKVGKSAASKSWFALKPNAEMRATILAALEQHKASRDWQKNGGQFVPHPATWLNGKRWLDEIEHSPTNPNRVFGGDGRLAL
jgi:hypothetical protein